MPQNKICLSKKLNFVLLLTGLTEICYIHFLSLYKMENLLRIYFLINFRSISLKKLKYVQLNMQSYFIPISFLLEL